MWFDLTEQFGEEYVSKWNFESWNEPKMRHFDGLNMTIKGMWFLTGFCFYVVAELVACENANYFS